MKVVLFIISSNSIEAQNVSANWRAIKKNYDSAKFCPFTYYFFIKIKSIKSNFFYHFLSFLKKKNERIGSCGNDAATLFEFS